MAPKVGLLSPGDMGAAVARRLAAGGVEVITCLGGRSERTRRLCAAAGLRTVDDDVALVRSVDLILSIVPPAEAERVGMRVAMAMNGGVDHRPVFVDCNAVAPATVQRIAGRIVAAGLVFVDAGIIGPPPRVDGTTRFYASGQTDAFLALNQHGLDIRHIGAEVGAASALKMCYAASTKGFIALCAELLAAAEQLGVAAALADELDLSQPHLRSLLDRLLPTMPSKSHRWVGEMEQITLCFAAVGLPPGIFAGVADLYRLVSQIPAARLTPEQGDSFPTVTEVATQIARAAAAKVNEEPTLASV